MPRQSGKDRCICGHARSNHLRTGMPGCQVDCDCDAFDLEEYWFGSHEEQRRASVTRLLDDSLWTSP